MDPSFRSFADDCPDAIVVTDAQGTIEYVNRAFEAMTGYSSAEVLGRTPALLKSGMHEADFYRRLWATLLAGGEFRAVFTNRRKTGELYHEDKIVRPLLGALGWEGFVSFGRDATERAAETAKLRHAATHDSLTDLPNRNLFLDRLGQALRQAARRNEELTVAIVDVDNFRDVNTRYGHLGGDAVLQTVASRTAGCVRDSDTVARIGGDEFAVILTGAGEHSAAAALEKVVAANSEPVALDDQAIRITVSVGASSYPRDALRDDELRKHADQAMYEAKGSGGNRLRFYGS